MKQSLEATREGVGSAREKMSQRNRKLRAARQSRLMHKAEDFQIPRSRVKRKPGRIAAETGTQTRTLSVTRDAV
jgi:hypothetical protein